MKKQVAVIHGGDAFDTYEKYLDSLINRQVDSQKFKAHQQWQSSLDKELGEDFEIFIPRMPNPDNAHYPEWKIWFEKMIPFISDEVILIGRSLGGIFLAKYLSENICPKKIKTVVLIGAPFDVGSRESLGDFTLSASLEKFSGQVEKIYLIFSQDDPVVPFTQLGKYRKALPNSEEIIFTDRQHFNQESFPEIIELIKKIK